MSPTPQDALTVSLVPGADAPRPGPQMPVRILTLEIPDTDGWDIDRHTQALRGLFATSAIAMWQIGKHFSDVKKLLGSAKAYDLWLKDTFEWSRRTADRLVNVYTTFEADALQGVNMAPAALHFIASADVEEGTRAVVLEAARQVAPNHALRPADVRAVLIEQGVPQPLARPGGATVAPQPDRARLPGSRAAPNIPQAELRVIQPRVEQPARLTGGWARANLADRGLAVALRESQEALASAEGGPVRTWLAKLGLDDGALAQAKLGYLSQGRGLDGGLTLPKGLLLPCYGAGNALGALWSLDMYMAQLRLLGGDNQLPVLMAGVGRNPKVRLHTQGLAEGLRLWTRVREHADVVIGLEGPPRADGVRLPSLATFSFVPAPAGQGHWEVVPSVIPLPLRAEQLRRVSEVASALAENEDAEIRRLKAQDGPGGASPTRPCTRCGTLRYRRTGPQSFSCMTCEEEEVR